MTERFKKLFLVRFFYELPGVSSVYHFTLAFLGALAYAFPSKKLTVIGVTGTKGKTTVCNLIAQILESAGHKTGLATTVNFKVGDKEWINDMKQTMSGRFALQKLLRDMVRAGCKYAVIETSSEGILQYRHRFIDYSVAVFTNLTPEHIERHGSFEKYREAKVKLFEQVAKKEGGIGVYNLDDPSVGYFLAPSVGKKYGFFTQIRNTNHEIPNKYQILNVKLDKTGSEFGLGGKKYKMPLIGEFNVYNAAAAICVALSQGVSTENIRDTLSTIKPTPGRFEIIDKGQDFTVVVDYAHEPASLEAVYQTAKELFVKSRESRIIGVLGSPGGGRDRWKRKAMGEVAAKYCDAIILTSDDSYDEPTDQIISEIKSGISNSQFLISNVLEIVDRGEAIRKAVSLARTGDIVLVTGKGGEVTMCVAGGKVIPWSDRKVVEEALPAK
jgi:UDP-N-acetylmuramoyl-L-alanyl-D-glutamate--2,6-diaminopimelate ligase